MDDRTVQAALQRHWEASDASDFEVWNMKYSAVPCCYSTMGEQDPRGRRDVQKAAPSSRTGAFAVEQIITAIVS